MGIFDFFGKKKEMHKEKEGKFAARGEDETIIPEHQREKEAMEEEARIANDPEAKKRELYERKKQLMREKAMAGTGQKKTLGVCIPNHAKSADERKRLPRKEISPFDKLRIDYEKSNAEFNREFNEITEQEPEEPYDFEPELGVEQIEQKKSFEENVKKRTSVSFEQSNEENRDMLDRKAALEKEVKGVIAARRPFGGEAPETTQSTWGKAMPAFSKNENEEKIDEIDESIEKVGTYVPRFSKTAREKFLGERDAPIQPSAHGSFTVTGVYPGGDTTIISGEVTSGKVNKRMSAQKGNATIRVSEIKKGMEQVSELYEGEHGTIFTRGTINLVKYGDVLEFE